LTEAQMSYQPGLRDKANLPHDPLKALVAPRPIGWISTPRPRRTVQPRALQFL